MLAFFLEVLTRNDKMSRMGLINQCVQQLPVTLCVLDAILCYSYIESEILNQLCQPNGGLDQLLNLISQQGNTVAVKIVGNIVSFVGIECPECFSNEVFVKLGETIEKVLHSDSLVSWYHCLELIRLLCSDAPQIVENKFTSFVKIIVVNIQKIIQMQQNNEWEKDVSLEEIDGKDVLIISLIDVLSAFACHSWYQKYGIENMNDIVTLVVRLMCSPISDWEIQFESFSHKYAVNVLQVPSTTVPEAGIIFFHNIILHQIVPVPVLFNSSFQLLEQGNQLLQNRKRNFVFIRATGFLIMSICANYLTQAKLPLQKETNAVIVNVIKSDLPMIDMIFNEDFVRHDISYAILCVSSLLPSATYQDLAFFLTALGSIFGKFIQCPSMLPYVLRLLTHCLSIQDFTISPFYTSYFSALLNCLQVTSEELSFVLDTLFAYCKHLPAAGTLFQPLAESLLRCFLCNSSSPNVRNAILQIFTELFADRSKFMKMIEFIFPPLSTIFTFCSRQSSDYPTQTLLMISRLIIKYSMALGEELQQLLGMCLTFGKCTPQCFDLLLDIIIETLKKYLNIMENEQCRQIVIMMFEAIKECINIGLMEEENLLKKAGQTLMLFGIFHGKKIGENIIQLASQANGKGIVELQIAIARAFIAVENKPKYNQFIGELYQHAVKMHEMTREKGGYQNKIHGMYLCELLKYEEVDTFQDEHGVPFTIISLLQLYLDLLSLDQIYNEEKFAMDQSRNGEMQMNMNNLQMNMQMPMNQMNDFNMNNNNNFNTINTMNQMMNNQDMSDEEEFDDWESDDYEDDYYGFDENHIQMSGALENNDLQLISRDDLFYSSYREFLTNFFASFKMNCPKQRFMKIHQACLNYNKGLYDFLSM